MTTGPPKIELQGITKSFPADRQPLVVLQDVNFTVQEGEFVSIIGPSGCGKSTLLSIVAGLLQPDGGRVLLDGEERKQRLGAVGYMQQKDLLLPWRTVLDNAILGLEVQGMKRAPARRRASALMERFGLRGFERNYPYALSGGMRQRAAFLRTVLAGHSVILLDEPFGALDALTRTHMQEWLLEQWQALEQTVVLITHDVDEAVFLSNRVYVLTARPGQVKLVQDVPLPRPRHYTMVTWPDFVQMKGTLMTTLREESLSPLGETAS